MNPDASPATTAPEQPWPSGRQGWYVVLLLSLCSMAAFIDRQIINLLVEDIKRDLQISDTQISLLQGLAFALFYAAAAIPLGRLADSGPRKILIAAGMMLATVATAACGLARSFAQFFVARVGVGIGEAVLTPAGFSMVADMFRPSRLALPLSVVTSASFVGSGLALLAGGAVIAWLGTIEHTTLPFIGGLSTWQAAFVLAALPGAVMALVLLATVREPLRRRRASVQDPDQPSLREVLAFCTQHRRIMWAVFGGISLLAANQFALGAWVPAHFIRNHGWTPSDVGYTYGLIFLFCGTGGVTAGGWLVGRLQRAGWLDAHLRVAMISALGSLPFAATFSVIDNTAGSVACLAAAVFFGTLAFGAGPSLLPVLCPPRMRAVVVAGYLLAANLIGQAGGPAVVALFTDYLFGANELVRYSLVAASLLLLSSGAALIYGGMTPLRRLAADLRE